MNSIKQNKIKTPFKELKDFLRESKDYHLNFYNSGRKWIYRIYNHVIKFYNWDKEDDKEEYRYSEHNVINVDILNVCEANYLKIEIVINKLTEDNTVEKIYITDLYTIYEDTKTKTGN